MKRFNKLILLLSLISTCAAPLYGLSKKAIFNVAPCAITGVLTLVFAKKLQDSYADTVYYLKELREKTIYCNQLACWLGQIQNLNSEKLPVPLLHLKEVVTAVKDVEVECRFDLIPCIKKSKMCALYGLGFLASAAGFS